MIRTTNFDAIATSAPLDRDAATVRDGSGDLYDKRASGFEGARRWHAPPPLKSSADFCADHRATVAAHVGRRLGTMVVLGIWRDGNPKKKSTWVCRCDCGYYEGRKLKTLLGLGDEATCSHCLQTRRLRAMAAKPSTTASRKAAADRLDALTQSGGSR